MKRKLMKGEEINSSEFNNELRINFVDKNDVPIKLISQIQAGRILTSGLGDLVLTIPPTIRFIFEKERWHDIWLFKAPSSKFRKNNRLQPRRSKLYGNYQIQNTKGEKIFFCSTHKALWYLNREICEIVNIDPPILRLKFITKGDGHKNDPFYLEYKENICVVCGGTENLTRHHCIPSMYRRHMPEDIKDHNYHDVLLTCAKCHISYEAEADKLKVIISKEYGLKKEDHCDRVLIYENVKIMKLASALVLHGSKIPSEKKLSIINELKKLTGKEITNDEIEELSRLSVYKDKENHMEAGQIIVENTPDLQSFAERWRMHFLEKMNPKFMPKFWDVKKPVLRHELNSTHKEIPA